MFLLHKGFPRITLELGYNFCRISVALGYGFPRVYVALPYQYNMTYHRKKAAQPLPYPTEKGFTSGKTAPG